MPTLVIYTNVLGKDFPENWHKEMTELVSKLLGKPEKFIAVIRFDSVAMTFGGSSDPCAVIQLSSIGKISEEENRSYVPAITEFIERTLKIPKDRFYINFHDRPGDMMARNGDLLKKPS